MNPKWDVSNMTVKPLKQSVYLEPMEIHYKLNGVQMKWDYIEIPNCVVVIIFNVTRKVFICVKQFRPTVYVYHIPKEERKDNIDCTKYPIELGVTLEFCAGMNDKSNLTCEETAIAEILEETGYNVQLEKLEKVRTYRGHVSGAANVVHMYYTEVEDSMKVGKGGGVAEEGEFIEVVEISLEEAKKICEDPNVDDQYVALLYGLLWFFHLKAPALNLY